MSHILKSPNESIHFLAEIFGQGNGTARLEVREDKCFAPNSWLFIGHITTHPSPDEQLDGETTLEQAIRFGSYSWALPTFDAIRQAIDSCYLKRTLNPKQKLSHDDRTRRALEAIVHSCVRCGFVHPTFDAGSVSEMPFTRPTTVVVDTSGILQGGLDFVVRFLYPMARIKIPAIAHMEILNMTERYFSQRRAADGEFSVASALLDHVNGQGGQRVLLRLELQTEAEIERPRLGADPLRGIIHPDTDSEHKSLGLQVVQRSFADRLILETAIQHRDRLSPDHPIVVLTADQGLARMTLAEGLLPLFFSCPPMDHVCGATLTGTCFRPFVEEMGECPYFCISLASVLWEFASTFGSARLITENQSHALTVSAIGEGLTWHPYHSRDDLLWTSRSTNSGQEHHTQGTNTPNADGTSSVPLPATQPDSYNSIAPPQQSPEEQTAGSQKAALRGSYRFSLPTMLHLVLAFERRDRISDKTGMQIVGLATPKRYADLRNFLLAGDFVVKTADGLAKAPGIDDLVQAMRSRDLDSLRRLILRVPSFQAFVKELSLGRPTLSEAIQSISQSAFTTYIGLAEICCAAVDIAGEGVYATPHSPVPSEFAPMAIDSYNTLRHGEEYVLTGKWLEQLVRHYGIHPIKARDRLNEAREAGLLERYTEGSTPETQYERHKIEVLEVIKGQPSIRSLNLYHGDFLIPGKASVSIRLEERRK